MPFEKGVTPEGAKVFEIGQSGNPAGKIPGTKNRSTIARKILEMRGLLPQATYEKLKEVYPELTQQMTAEEMATLVQLVQAITKGDVNAYKAVMDSAYGAPKQEIDASVSGQIAINITNDEAKLGE